MRIALMIEGQEDVTWPDWMALAEACEEHGIEALMRSDHYVSVAGEPRRGALDAWGTICALAARTSTLRLGTLVSPASFRHPSILAKLAVTADHVSGGRVELGLGTGWHEPEHRAFGFPYHDMRTRMDVLEEQLAVVTGHWGEVAFDHDGEHYALHGLEAFPKPVAGRMPLIMGGQAGPRAARLAAAYADEYNTVYASPEECAQRRAAVRTACERAGRDPIPFSLMTRVVLRDVPDDADPAWLTGSVEAVVARLHALAAVGVERVYLQHLDHRDLETVRIIGEEIVPAMTGASSPGGSDPQGVARPGARDSRGDEG